MNELPTKCQLCEGSAWVSPSNSPNTLKQCPTCAGTGRIYKDSTPAEKAAFACSGWLGVDLIRAERRRQISGEGWGAEHDDTHEHRELARAAAAYLKHYIARVWIITDELGLGIEDGLAQYQSEPPPDEWPEEWEVSWWKPKDAMQDLVRVGALIAAEIDRLYRQRRKTPNDKLTDGGPKTL